MDDGIFMEEAIAEAKLAEAAGEVPVGAVLVREGRVIAKAHNLCEINRDPTAHAEMLALREGTAKTASWRFSDCTLYVTMEPCPMCAGAIVNARVGRVVFGTPDMRMGALGSLLDLRNYPLEYRPEVTGGVMAEECRTLLHRFFENRRKKS